MKIIERDENKQERTNVGFYEVALCSRCANRVKHARASRVTFGTSFESEHIKRLQVLFGTPASSKREQWLVCTRNGSQQFWASQWMALWLFSKGATLFFPLSLCVYTLFYLDPRDLSHLDENYRSLMWVKQNYCASPAFFFFFFIGSIG